MGVGVSDEKNEQTVMVMLPIRFDEKMTAMLRIRLEGA